MTPIIFTQIFLGKRRFHGTTLFKIFTFYFISIIFTPSLFATTQTRSADYELALSFNLYNHTLSGTTKITIDRGKALTIDTANLNITGGLLKEQDGGEYIICPQQRILTFQASDKKRILILSYNRQLKENAVNCISTRGIVLSKDWYPLPSYPMFFKITADLPGNFTAITESDTFPLIRNKNQVKGKFSRPLRYINFVAGPYTIQKKLVRPGLFVYTMFFKEDRTYAGEFLQNAATYLNHFESKIGPYPFHHFVVVANKLPSGCSVPTFTLLGQSILGLPFTKRRSLAHEIVHSWFGNGVFVDYQAGNWSEGLTTFLADYSVWKMHGTEVANRKEDICKYLSYVHKQNSLTLADFKSADHRQSSAMTKRTIGYNRGALLFHELELKIGQSAFTAGIRSFYEKYNGSAASWESLRHCFETAAHISLRTFFTERLTRPYIPDITIEDVTTFIIDNQPALSFSLVQKSLKPFTLKIPLTIVTAYDVIHTTLEVNQHVTKIQIPLKSIPLSFTVDPRYDLLRKLTPRELPATLSRFLGDEKKLIIIGSEEERKIYDPLLAILNKEGATVTDSNSVTNQKLGKNSLVFLGTNQKAYRSLFGAPRPGHGVQINVRHNPLNPDHVALLLTSESRAETLLMGNRFLHYGNYSLLTFQHGKNITRQLETTETGIHIVIEKLPVGGKTENITSFSSILNELSMAKIIYIGETHNSPADHLLQYRVIEGLFKKNHKIAIGMEMFPASSQPTLDNYTLSDTPMSETEFLRQSDYFNIWNYDYRLFRNIFNFAQSNHIPVIGLNLDRKTVAKVFRSGNTDSLSKSTLATLPLDRNLGIKGYTERLRKIHDGHIRNGHSAGSTSGFIQAQALWDETMAENISGYLKKNPGRQLIVLAGSEHTRKDYGIPPRVRQRTAVKQLSVVNIHNAAPADITNVADYYFLVQSPDLPATPRIGISLVPETKNNKNILKIAQTSPHGKAGEAGIQQGDILKEINSIPVSTMGDLRIIMLNAKAGDNVHITVLRNVNNTYQELSFTVELTPPPSP